MNICFQYCFLLLLVAGMFLTGCGVMQPVRVLEDGQTQLAGSLGGPFVPLKGTMIPVPYLTAGIVHGYSNTLTGTANLHLLALLFGDLGVDAGVAARLLKQDAYIPEVTGKMQVTIFDDFTRGNNLRVYPQISVNASYRVWEADLIYFGVESWFQSGEPRSVLSPFVGFQFPLSRQWTAQVESKWMAANVYSAHGIFEGQGNIGGYGNTSIFVGILYSW